MAETRPQQDNVVAGWRNSLARMRKRHRPRVGLPLTPMIDVTFLLLLYFLLTSSFRDPERQLPGAVPSPDGEPGILLPIHVTLEPAGPANEGVWYRIDESEPTQEASRLYAALAERATRLADPEVPVVIHPGEDVRWAYVIEVFNAASTAGFAAVTFAPAGPSK